MAVHSLPELRAGRSGPVRVLEILGNAIVGGMESYVKNLVSRLPRKDFEVTCVVPFESPMTAMLRETGASVFVTPLRDDPPWRSIEMITTLIDAYSIDVIHAHLLNAHTVGALAGALRGVPVIATVHGVEMSSQEISVARLCRSHLIVVCQAAQARALAAGLPAELVTLIPNGVDLDRFAATASVRDEMRRELGLEPSAALVGFVGRIAHEKGPDKFLKVVRHVASHRPDAQFVMAGDGQMLGEIQREIASLGLSSRVHCLGAVAAVERVYAALDVLVQTSRSEAMPLVLLEAMAAGVAIVAIGVGGVPEVLSSDDAGILIGDTDWPGIASAYPADWQGAAAAVLDLLGNEERRARLAAAARVRAERCFSIGNFTLKTAGLLREAAGRKLQTASRTSRGAGPARSTISLSAAIADPSE